MTETNKTIIEIASIERRPVTKKNGEQSMIIAVTDARTKRVGETWDQTWTASWKIGDTVEVSFGEPKLWTNPKNGVTKETWPIKNPNEKPKFGPRTFNSQPSSESAAWTVAATLLAPHFVGKKIDLSVVAELAEKVKIAMTPVAKAVPQMPQETVAPAAQTPVAAPAAAAYTAPAAPQVAPAQTVLDESEADFIEDVDKPF